MTCIDNLSDAGVVHLALVDVNHEQNRRHVSDPLDHVLKAKIIRPSTDQLNYLKMPGQASNIMKSKTKNTWKNAHESDSTRSVIEAR